MLQLLKRPRSVLKNFLAFVLAMSSFCPVLSDLQKKRHCADEGIFFSNFMLISKKKKVLHLSSARFLRALCDIHKQDAVNRSYLRFLAGNKNAVFWQGKKCQNSQKFIAKMPEKSLHFLHFFALIGNTNRLSTTDKISA